MRGSERRHSARTMSCDLWGSESQVTGSAVSGSGSSGSSSVSLSSLSSLSLGWSLRLRELLPKVPKSLLSEELDEFDEDAEDQLGEEKTGYPGSKL